MMYKQRNIILHPNSLKRKKLIRIVVNYFAHIAFGLEIISYDVHLTI